MQAFKGSGLDPQGISISSLDSRWPQRMGSVARRLLAVQAGSCPGHRLCLCPYLCHAEGHFLSVFFLEGSLPRAFEVNGINEDQHSIEINGAWYQEVLDVSWKKEARQRVLRHTSGFLVCLQ